MAEEYQVKQGDCIGSIAYEHGFFWKTLWNDSHNAELKQQRKDPNVLLEGDVVFIPDPMLKEESGATEQRHRFRLKGVPAKLRLRILEPEPAEAEDPCGEQIELDDWPEPVQPQSPSARPVSGWTPTKPRANVPYLLWVDDVATRGETKTDGLIECSIAPNARKARLVLDPGTAKESVIHLKLGHLDPVGEISGVQARLNNLGFRCGPVDAVLGPRTRRALEDFQASAGLEATGELDERTRQKLHEAHEST
jgi:N-acetylmuramoyl-L-alanine amidase